MNDQLAKTTRPDASLPHSVWAAMGRGICGRCPRCSQTKLFRKFLKPVASCTHCGQDWTYQRADDFPAYMAIIITGHFIGFLMVELAKRDLSTLAMTAIIVPLTIVMVIALIQPAKGAIIAIQWWIGMHGFAPGRDAKTLIVNDASRS